MIYFRAAFRYGNTGRMKGNGVIIIGTVYCTYFFDTFCFNRFGQRSVVIQTFVLKQQMFIVYSWFERKVGNVRWGIRFDRKVVYGFSIVPSFNIVVGIF